MNVVYVEPARHEGAKDKALHLLRKFNVIDPTIGGMRNRSDFSNVYMSFALFRSGCKAEANNITGHFGCVIDDDAASGKRCILPSGIVPTFIIETSRTGETVNHQYQFFFDRIVSPAEFKRFLELLYRKCGGDSCIKNPAQPFRVPGTLNHPSLAKIKAGRSPIPQPVKITGGIGQLNNFDALVAALEAMPDPMPGRGNPGVPERGAAVKRMPKRS